MAEYAESFGGAIEVYLAWVLFFGELPLGIQRACRRAFLRNNKQTIPRFPPIPRVPRSAFRH
jgi:hypothetical protein